MPIIKIPSTSTAITIPACPYGLERLLIINGIKRDILVELNTTNWGIINILLSSSAYSTTLSMVDTEINSLSTSYSYKNLYKVIKVINNRYGTHLSEVEMDKITEIIWSRCHNAFSDLISELSKPLLKSSTNNLFYDICTPFTGAVNVSFASKFYFSFDKFVTKGFSNFCKYDRIVAKKVAIYEEIYCGSAAKKNYEIKSETQIKKYEAYFDYVEAIDKICKATGLNREQFDNIVWFTNK